MTLNQVLERFDTPSQASELCGKSRTTGYHWFAEGPKRVIPPIDVLVCWADHFKLSDDELGKLVRDCLMLQKMKPRKRQRRVLKPKPEEPIKKWEAKEQYLNQIEKNNESAIEESVFERMQHILERHIK